VTRLELLSKGVWGQERTNLLEERGFVLDGINSLGRKLKNFGIDQGGATENGHREVIQS
jgi:hypothetical protein